MICAWATMDAIQRATGWRARVDSHRMCFVAELGVNAVSGRTAEQVIAGVRRLQDAEVALQIHERCLHPRDWRAVLDGEG